MRINARLESERHMGRLYRIYRVMDDLTPLLNALWEEGAILDVSEQNEASLMDDMITDREELFRRLLRELEMEEGLVEALLVVPESKNPSMVIKIDAYITWRLLLNGEKVSVNEAADG